MCPAVTSRRALLAVRHCMREEADVLARRSPQGAWAADVSAQLRHGGGVRDVVLLGLRFAWASGAGSRGASLALASESGSAACLVT